MTISTSTCTLYDEIYKLTIVAKSIILARILLLFFPNFVPKAQIWEKHIIRIKTNVLAHPAKSETGVSISAPQDKNIMTKIKNRKVV